MTDAALVLCMKPASGKVMLDWPRDMDYQMSRIVGRRYPRSQPNLALRCPAMIKNPFLFFPKRIRCPHRFDGGSLNAILADIEADAARGEYRDYDAAEQAAMAAQSVIVAFENSGAIDKARADALKAKLDAVYAVLKNENGYSMGSFQSALKALKNAAP